MYKAGFPIGPEALTYASQFKNWEAVKWLHKKGAPLDSGMNIVDDNNLEMLKWWREKGGEWNPCLSSALLRAGNFESARYAYEDGCTFTDDDLSYAFGFVDTKSDFDWLLSVAKELKASYCQNVAKSERGQNGKVLSWLREAGCPWDEKTCSALATRGNLTLLKWAREQGCPWDVNVCYDAAEKGRCDVLLWAIDNGCECSPEVSLRALIAQKLNILEVLFTERSEFWHRDTLREAALYMRGLVIEWAQQKGIIDDATLKLYERQLRIVNRK